MQKLLASRIMRTTLDIDDPILRDLKALQAREGKSLGRLVSDLLAQALAASGDLPTEAREFRWFSRAMGARVDLADRDAVLDAMDERAP
jgi:hypothetical protein